MFSFYKTLTFSFLLSATTVLISLGNSAAADGSILYRESKLGIDYRAIADAPVDAMLSQGEAEWLVNSSENLGNRNKAFWTRISSVLGQGRISKSYEDALRKYAPNMLLSFGDIDPNHPKYMLLASIGDSFRLDRYLEPEE